MAAEHPLLTKLIAGAHPSPSWLPNIPFLTRSSLKLGEATAHHNATTPFVEFDDH
ncbi:hypothetical protein L484_002251 [Morus notabilis]|uniref:Uncharacterized protein n=1 Tax=Morus notabilis TaxID=981085 RepID=W9SUX6_9ROSA|nr:hypothetical protein L484_002251 [Morus notabilis]